MNKTFDEFEKALVLVENSTERVSPRPSVGAIIFKNGRVIGKGITSKRPGNHAETNAIESAKDNLKGSTLYTTLEPCFHTGDTSPCVEAIIRSGISKVVIGSVDPNPETNGKSLDKLRKNNINVSIIENHSLRGRSEKIIESFTQFILTKKPFVTAKFAISLDGKISTRDGDSKWISSERSRGIVHKLRSLSDAIMIGSNTLLYDNPSLSAHGYDIQPEYKIVLNSRPTEVKKFKNFCANGNILVYCTQLPERLQMNKKLEFIKVSESNQGVDLEEVLNDLGDRNCVDLLVEGGGKVLGSFFDQNLVNKIHVFIAPKIIGGESAPSPIEGLGINIMKNSINIENLEIKTIDKDIMVSGKIASRSS